jgi:exodeoxyribonuclease-3
VAWNCCDRFDRGRAQLETLGCDLAVLAEVPEHVPVVAGTRPMGWNWVGDTGARGLAVASFGTTFDQLDNREGTGSLSIAGTTGAGTGVLGIWALPANRGQRYGPEVTAAIDAHADWLRDVPSIIAGDLNLAPLLLEDARNGVLQHLFSQLDSLGYVSAYHHTSGEVYGSETRHTYFHHWKKNAPFHIDHCFLHRSLLPQLQTLELGTFEKWVDRSGDIDGYSDHVPLIVDIDMDP